ncbi:kinase-like domain-containing protein, partial [Rhodocollybia butyracea]
FSQEALIWSQLDHPNVLPFLGVNTVLFPQSYCLVSPWCSNGSVMAYLIAHPAANLMKIIRDILEGLRYLHVRNPPIIHGDVKGSNILVSNQGRCCLADFGLAGISTLQTMSSSSAGTLRGSTRWMAPELFDYTTKSKPSMSTDMYALGCTFVELVTGNPPFFEVKPQAAVIYQVMKGSRPSRPTKGFSDRLWSCVTKCWVDSKHRPTVEGFMVDYDSLSGSSMAHAWRQLPEPIPEELDTPGQNIWEIPVLSPGSYWQQLVSSPSMAILNNDREEDLGSFKAAVDDGHMRKAPLNLWIPGRGPSKQEYARVVCI